MNKWITVIRLIHRVFIILKKLNFEINACLINLVTTIAIKFEGLTLNDNFWLSETNLHQLDNISIILIY